jgi:hypothetical protein
LQHPNIVKLYEIGESEGHPYFSLEFLESGSPADQFDGTARKNGRRGFVTCWSLLYFVAPAWTTARSA